MTTKLVLEARDFVQVSEEAFCITKDGYAKAMSWIELMNAWNIAWQDIYQEKRQDELRAFLLRAGYAHADKDVFGARVLLFGTLKAFRESQN